MKYWKCSVCGYIHEGDYPPIKCPICGADRTKFIEISKKEGKKAKKDFEQKNKKNKNKENKSLSISLVEKLMTTLHVHPVSVHIPNGVLPMVIIFLILGYFFKKKSFIDASFYGLIYVTISMSVVLYTGFFDWKTNYNKILNKYFLAKIFSGFIVFITGLILIIWKLVDPEVSSISSPNFDVFLIIHIIMLLFALLAGFLGGKLVFNSKRE